MLPPFCPYKSCVHHHDRKPCGRPWYRKRGWYTTVQGKRVQRFQCLSCRRSFSTRTFSIDYFTHKHLVYQRILTHLSSCSGIRDIARDMKVSPSTILNRISRLARQTIAVHHELSMQLKLGESLVADGFESYAVSQYFPNTIHLLAGKDSQFWYASDYAHLRRKKAMGEWQNSRNAVMQGCFSSGRVTVYVSFSRIMEAVERLQSSSGEHQVKLYTDTHPQYQRVIEDRDEKERFGVVHQRVCSRLTRSMHNPLFAVNYLDRQIRKDCAEHVRETVKYARNVSNSMERLAIYRFCHNYMKPYRVGQKRYVGVSHGMMAGIRKEAIEEQKRTVFSQRRFLSRTGGLSFSEALVWLRGIATPLKRYAEHLPAYAWQ